MKILCLVVFFIPVSLLFTVSIQEIQYTTFPGDGTYPSPLEGTILNTGGIVSGIDFHNGRFFISSSAGGAWNGIYVYDNDYFPQIGDSVSITAQVYEYYGFTELSEVTSCEFYTDQPLPPASEVTTGQINSAEAYESVLVKINNAEVVSVYDEYNNWLASDGSTACFIGPEFFYNEDITELIPLLPGYQFEEIKGIVSYSYGEYRLNPRTLSDFVSSEDGMIVSTETQDSGEVLAILIKLSFWGDLSQINSCHFQMSYNPDLISFNEYITAGTLSQNGTLTVTQPFAGQIDVSFTGSSSFINTQTFVKLSFFKTNTGSFTPEFPLFQINEDNVLWFNTGEVTITPANEAVGDTITVIQQPLINIPEMVLSGSDFTVRCIAPANTTQWQAALLLGESATDADILDAEFDSESGFWFLTVSTPENIPAELYDLKITASNQADDVSGNSVMVINEYKENFYFAHVTDLHLPTHEFWEEGITISDSSEVEDFREVIRDINLIRPEFVLLTGDLVNEGELEDFENRRYYSIAMRLLNEFEVPVYVTSGNHDLGGWNDTPPQQGTARRNWWKFFGWNYLENPPAGYPLTTQNYAFDYGNVHFIGMEAYNNYDNFMHDVYGSDSFTSQQLQWLEDELLSSEQSAAQVLFYHYDFTEQIDLTSLGADMALSGHTHQNDGNIFDHPFDLITEAVCDGNRAYRIINVAEDMLIPQSTVYSGWNGDNLTISFNTPNNGGSNSVQATIHNGHNLNFDNTLIKFCMPAESEEFSVTNGIIEQIRMTQEATICYVSAGLSANSNLVVTCQVFGANSEEDTPALNLQMHNFPNPFRDKTFIKLTKSKNEKCELSVYNIKGKKIRSFPIPDEKEHTIIWDGTDSMGMSLSSGIYFCRFSSESQSITRKMLLLR